MGLARQGALPNRSDAPARRRKRLILPPVPLDVLFELVAPERLPALWPAKQVAVVAMPETAMHEHHGIPACENEVGLAGQVFAVQAEAESAPVQRGSDYQLGFGVLALDPCHHPASGCGRDGIRRHYSAAIPGAGRGS